MRSWKALFALVVVIVLLSLGSQLAILQEEDPHPRNAQAELEVLTEINRWRLRLGLVPLARNSLLDELAERQARYVVGQAPFTGTVEFHIDQFGDGVFRRAELAGWPVYDYPGRVLVSEIAAYYPDVAGAINFWQNSPVHAASVANQGFREAGVAVIMNRNWLLSYVVMGGRPDVLPVLYDPTTRQLFLTTDRSYFSSGYRPTRVRILNSNGEQLHDADWLPWAERIPLPAGASPVITVIYSDGIRQITTEVDLNASRVFPAEPLPTPSPTPSLIPVVPTFTPRPPTAVPSPTPGAVAGTYDILMQYDEQSWTLTNQSARVLDLLPMVIVAESLGQSRTAAWLGQFSEVPLTIFPPGFCLQAWSFELDQTPPPLPDGCIFRASGRSILNPGERFWLAGRFTVMYAERVIASCHTSAQQCAFDIPDE